MILEISNQIQQAVIILKLQMNIPVSILVRSLNLTNCFYKEKVLEVAFGKRTVVASRLGVGNIFGSNAPFLNFKIKQMAVLTLWEENNPLGIEQIFCRAHYGLLI
jgi:hypothetical protein